MGAPGRVGQIAQVPRPRHVRPGGSAAAVAARLLPAATGTDTGGSNT
ncbi:amidase family protein [Pseudomonas aeruginosa]